MKVMKVLRNAPPGRPPYKVINVSDFNPDVHQEYVEGMEVPPPDQPGYADDPPPPDQPTYADDPPPPAPASKFTKGRGRKG